MRILGINCLNHDAAVSVIEDGNILFAAHSERYSKIKNDMYLNDDIMALALSYGVPDKIAYYERPWIKKSRQLYAGQYKEVFNLSNLPSTYLKKWINTSNITYIDHHYSHAAAGYFTSPYKDAAILVIDGIGEWDVLTIWHATNNTIKKVYSIKYPNSLGLFYSAVTQQANLKPCEEEYILMGMSAWGKPIHSNEIYNDLFNTKKLLKLKYNLHKGLGTYGKEFDTFDLASSAQIITENILDSVIKKTKELVSSNNLVFMGGVALNCVANSNVLFNYYDNVWIMPNPGDAGSSLGAAAAVYGQHLNWETPFLGTDIKGPYPINTACDLLIKGHIIGVANGRSEFGPRALGNRSLLADPRGSDIKDRVNDIKQRQKFRPFAPAVLEEHAHEIFEMPTNKIPYMQYTVKCKLPDIYPAICHIDNTSRVQTVSKKDNPGFYSLIKLFYEKTGCPMLLNTSLNIKGQPIVDNERDAINFENYYNVKVLTCE